MELASGSTLRNGPTSAGRQALLIGLIAVSCALTMRAELFVVAAAALSAWVAVTTSRAALWRAFRTIDRAVLTGCVVMLVLWIYGVVIGLAQGNPFGHILRNFFGLAFFLPSVLSASLLIGRGGISRVVAASGVGALSILVVLRTASVFAILPQEVFRWLGMPVGVSDFGLRLYSFGSFPIFGWQALACQGLYRALRDGDLRRAGIMAGQVLLIVAGTAYVTESKGILLGSVAVLAVPILLQRHWMDHLKYALAASAIVGLHIGAVTPGASYLATDVLRLERSETMASLVEKAKASASDDRDAEDEAGGAALAPGSLLNSIFGAQRLGNSERYAQVKELLNDLSIQGNGLGAPISSGYSRSVAYPYGFELSFLNLIHKLGVFSLLYFGFLGYSGYRVVNSAKPLQERCAALGLLGYVFPAIGNPILFAVQAVFLHAIALHAVTRHQPTRILPLG